MPNSQNVKAALKGNSRIKLFDLIDLEEVWEQSGEIYLFEFSDFGIQDKLNDLALCEWEGVDIDADKEKLSDVMRLNFGLSLIIAAEENDESFQTYSNYVFYINTDVEGKEYLIAYYATYKNEGMGGSVTAENDDLIGVFSNENEVVDYLNFHGVINEYSPKEALNEQRISFVLENWEPPIDSLSTEDAKLLLNKVESDALKERKHSAPPSNDSPLKILLEDFGEPSPLPTQQLITSNVQPDFNHDEYFRRVNNGENIDWPKFFEFENRLKCLSDDLALSIKIGGRDIKISKFTLIEEGLRLFNNDVEYSVFSISDLSIVCIQAVVLDGEAFDTLFIDLRMHEPSFHIYDDEIFITDIRSLSGVYLIIEDQDDLLYKLSTEDWGLIAEIDTP